ncbi:hypothetical protein ACI65C_010071 [Semiaphis heraclei]
MLSASAYYVKTYSPITLYMKSDYSWCTNATYPSSCVNMNTVIMNGTGISNTTNTSPGSITAFRTIESIIVIDIDSNENKCIILFDTYNCQGRNLVLNGSKYPSANLHNYKFSNVAESYKQCTDLSLSWLRDSNSNN